MKFNRTFSNLPVCHSNRNAFGGVQHRGRLDDALSGRRALAPQSPVQRDVWNLQSLKSQSHLRLPIAVCDDLITTTSHIGSLSKRSMSSFNCTFSKFPPSSSLSLHVPRRIALCGDVIPCHENSLSKHSLSRSFSSSSYLDHMSTR